MDREMLHRELMGYLLLSRALCPFQRTFQVIFLYSHPWAPGEGCQMPLSRVNSKYSCGINMDQTGKRW